MRACVRPDGCPFVVGLTRFDGHLKTGDTGHGGVHLNRKALAQEFKAETVALIRRSGKSIAEVCREMGCQRAAYIAGSPRPTSMLVNVTA